MNIYWIFLCVVIFWLVILIEMVMNIVIKTFFYVMIELLVTCILLIGNQSV